jgi:hypothetical protein
MNNQTLDITLTFDNRKRKKKEKHQITSLEQNVKGMIMKNNFSKRKNEIFVFLYYYRRKTCDYTLLIIILYALSYIEVILNEREK